MKTRPIIVSPDNPVGVDLAVKEIQDELEVIHYLKNGEPKQWFEGGVIFGLAEGIEPKMLWKGKDFYPLSPNDNISIMAFFYESDPRRQTDYHNVYNLNLIVWFDQDNITDADYRIKEYLINDIQNALDLEMEVYKEKKNIYRDFKLKNDDYITSRFDGFRLKFNYAKEIDCGIKLSI